MLSEFYADLHVHLGWTQDGRPVKVTAARHQVLPLVLEEASSRKGLDILGIVDAACPPVLAELEALVREGRARELAGGGLRYAGKTTVFLGAEVEVTEEDGRCAHWLAFFPTLAAARSFSRFLERHVANPGLSTQQCRLPARALLPEVLARDGIFFPAHAFTPHKGVYGQVTSSLVSLLGEEGFRLLPALELGLSADTYLADMLGELAALTFLSNSDAHSLRSLGREYNVLSLAEPTWEEFLKALRGEGGRRVAANYGLDPRLGKYHRTYCLACRKIAEAYPPPVLRCPFCGGEKVVKGVRDRVAEIGDRPLPQHPPGRPPYYYQVPLHFLPGVGPRTLEKLLSCFGTEMAVIHKASPEEISRVAGPKVGELIARARAGELAIAPGGGGRYGRVGS